MVAAMGASLGRKEVRNAASSREPSLISSAPSCLHSNTTPNSCRYAADGDKVEAGARRKRMMQAKGGRGRLGKDIDRSNREAWHTRHVVSVKPTSNP